MTAAPLRFVRLDVEGFGCLSGSFEFDPAKATLVVAPNEEGKSTLAAAILAVLYGVERDRRRVRGGGVLECDRFRPWSGGPYAASLEIERGGERFRVRRDFDRDDLAVRDGTGRDVTASFRTRDGDSFGEGIVGLTRAEFEKTVFVPHEDRPPGDEGELTARLQRLASSESGATAASASAALAGALDSYADARMGTRLQMKTEIARLEKRLAEVGAALASIDGKRQGLHAEFEAMQAHRDGIAALETECARETHLAARAEASEIAAAIAAEERCVEEIVRLAAERDARAGAASFPAAEADSVASVRTQIETLVETIAGKTTALARAGQALDDARARLAQLGAVASATPDDREAVVRVRDRLAGAAEEIEDALRRHMEEKARLAQKGIEPAEIETLRARFGSLSDEERDLASSEESFRKEAAAERRAAQDADERARLTIDGVRRGRSETRLWGVVLIVLGIAVGGVSFLAAPPGQWVAVGLGGVLFVAGLAVVFASFARGSDALASATAASQDAERRLSDLALRVHSHDQAMAALLQRTGHPDPVELSREYERWSCAQAEIRGFELIDERLRLEESTRRGLQEEVAATAARWGMAADGEPVGERPLADLAERMKRAESVRSEIDALEKEATRLRGDLSDEKIRLSRAREALLSVLRAAGVDVADSNAPEASVAAVDEMRRRHDEWKRLNETAIPTAERARRGDEWLAAQRERAARLEAAIAGGRREEWEVLVPGRADDHRARANECTAEARRLRESVHALEQRMSAFLEHEQPRRAALVAEKVDLERHLGRTRSFQSAVQLALETLETVSRETYASWSQALNELARDLIARMHPGIESVRFLEDLGVSVRIPGGRELSRDEAAGHLSAGARDQLALVVRVAISEYLSRGEVLLPFVLDDPLARTDDRRFAEVFRFLIERCGERHQLIVFSCHEARHAALEAEDPQWFQARVSRLVLGPAAVRAE